MGMEGETKLAMAMAGRAARACDVCGKERARWYCAADEAYLCEKCDGVVHNANPLSKRHERVRLAPNGAPMKIDRRSSDSSSRARKEEAAEPAAAAAAQPASSRHRHGTWRGYSKKRSRSGRRRTHSLAHLSHLSPTALLKVEDDSEVKLEPCSPLPEADAPHEVPNFLPDDCQELPVVCMSSNIFFQDVLSCSSWLINDDGTADDDALDFLVPDGNRQQCETLDDAPCLDSTLAEIPGDIMDDGTMLLNEITASSGIEILDIGPDGFGLDFPEMHSLRSCGSEAGDVAPCTLDTFQGASPFRQFSKAKTELDYEQHQTCAQDQQEYVHVQQNYGQQQSEIRQQQEEEYKPNLSGQLQIPKLELGSFLGCTLDELRKDKNRSVPCLRLNYEDVLNAWSERGMSWSDSRCPQTVPEDSNADSAVSSEVGIVPDMDSSMQEAGGMGPDEGCTGGGREARVMRYREKRRNRLFSKKIRYEVRKINAERRPRMKGRFVKKTGQ